MYAGRRLRIYRNGNAIAGAQTDAVTFNREPINVTDKDSRGVQALLAEAGTHIVEMNVEGVLVNEDLPSVINDASPDTPVLVLLDMQVADLGIYRGNWFVTNFVRGGTEGAEAMTFSATFTSAQEIELGRLFVTSIRALAPAGTRLTGSTLIAVVSFSSEALNFNSGDLLITASDLNGNPVSTLHTLSATNSDQVRITMTQGGNVVNLSNFSGEFVINFRAINDVVSSDATGNQPLIDTSNRFPPIRLVNGVIQ